MAVVVAVLAAVVVVVLPPVFGGIARSFLDDFDGRIPIGQAFGTDAELEVAFHDWDPGWFSSTAGLSLSGGFGGVGLFAAETPVVVTLRHGPLLSGVPSGLGWGRLEWVLDESTVPALRALYEETGAAPVAHLGLLLGFGSGARIGVDVSDFRLDAGDESYHFGGLEVVADVAGDRIDFDGKLGGLRFEGEDRAPYTGELRPVELELGRTALMASLYKDPRMPVLWLGDLRLDGAGFTQRQDQVDSEYGRFRLRVGTGIARDMFDVRIESELSDVRVSREDTGHYQLDDLLGEVGLQFGAETLARLLPSVDSGMDLERALAALATADALIRERLVLASRLSFSHEGRSASTALAVEYRGDELPAYIDIGNFARVVQNPARLPIDANFDLAFHQELPRGLLDSMGTPGGDATELEEAILEMAQSGVLEERGSDYRVRFEFADGVARLNGETLDRVMRRLGGSEAGEFLRLLADELL